MSHMQMAPAEQRLDCDILSPAQQRSTLRSSARRCSSAAASARCCAAAWSAAARSALRLRSASASLHDRAFETL